ncbi:MAG: sulfoxide reductase heme-binding subunit YedZ [Chloroflexi bacterium]|nr:sulfoxide reductase heme-binding subunit YedZ [Chloroflexota bacterium]
MKKFLQRYTPLQIIMHLGAWFPLARILVDLLADNLTANPIQAIEQRTGRAAVTLLLLSLACTPLNSLFGWKEPLKRRRALGLYTFMYAAIHVIIFADLDYGLAWSLILQTVFQKPYILVGMTAFLLLIPLAVTSFDIWKIRLKKNWKRLHQVIYFIAPLVILHYAWSKKGDIFSLQGDILRPLVYGIVLLLLMILRIPAVKRPLASFWTRLRVPFKEPRPRPQAPLD